MESANPDAKIVLDRRYFWHICAFGPMSHRPEYNAEKWWGHLRKRGQITAGFDDRPGDEGERILTSYERGDVILAYAIQFGAIGWGIVEDTKTYRLIDRGDADDMLTGIHRHRLDIRWRAIASRLKDAISASEMREKFQISHPPRTSLPMKYKNVRLLVDELTKRFGSVGA